MKSKQNDAHIYENFSLYIFASIFCSSSLSIIISYIMIYFGIFDSSGPAILFRIAISLFFCLLFGAFVSVLIGMKSNYYVKDIADAIKEVANGNFNYKLKVSDKLIFKDVAKSFNIMVNVLSSMEILRRDFVTNFSHEFRTPINSINGYAELLKNNKISDKDKEEYIDVIINESKRLFHLADNILYISNIGNAPRLPNLTNYRLDEQIRKIIVLLEKSWEEKDINLDIQLENIEIEAREEFLYQIWLNLINNAIKFTKDTVTISLSQNEENVIFKITDNGIGMNEETQKHIFDMFYQADASHNSGSGLGLSIVKKIVDILEYKIEVSSEIEKGSTFTVTINK